MNIIGEQISIARTKLKLTQDNLAEKTGLSRSYICDIENNRYTPSVKTLTAIAAILKMDLNFLTSMSDIQDGKPIDNNFESISNEPKKTG